MKLISKVTEIYCIADDFCKEYELELNKKALSLSTPSPNTPKTRNRKGRMSDAEMITILVLFHSNTFRNFKHFYLFYVCRELKEEFPNPSFVYPLCGTYATNGDSPFALPQIGFDGRMYGDYFYRFNAYSRVRKQA